MARRKSSVNGGGGGRRVSSVLRKSSSELPMPSISHVVESEHSEGHMAANNGNHCVTQAEELLQVVSILESEASEAAQKRQVLKLFEWFKAQYTQLSGALRSSVHREQSLMTKCRELKAELVLNVTKIQTQLKVHEVAAQNLAFFKEECERSWQAVHVSREREQEALKIIEASSIGDLRLKVISLEGQVKELQRQPPEPEKNPQRTVASRAATAVPSSRYMEEDISTFNEWKTVNKVWSPSKTNARSNELYCNNSPASLGERSAATGALPVTPMERAMTAAPQPRKKHESTTSRCSHRLPTV